MPNDIDQTPVAPADAEAATQAPSRSGRLRQALRHRSLALGMLISAVLTVLVLAPSLLHLVDPDNQDPALAFSPPSAEHLMGADSSAGTCSPACFTAAARRCSPAYAW